MPNLKTIRFIFPEELTPHQENIMVVNFKELKRRTIETIQNGGKDFDRAEIRAVMGGNADVQKAKFDIMVNLMESKMTLDKDKNVWSFSFPDEDMTGLSFKAFGRQVKLGRIVPEKKIIAFVKDCVCKDMGIDGKKVMYEVEEEPLKDLTTNP